MEMLVIQSLDFISAFYHNYYLPLAPFLAQKIEDPDVLGQMQDIWHNFIESGQVWALVIGSFFGYMFKSFTSY
jgi:hypothetical protein